MEADWQSVIETFTPQQAKEFLSFREFAGNFWSVPTKSKGYQPFRINRAQVIVDREFERQMKLRGFVRMNVLKCRQVGNTTYWTHRGLNKVIKEEGVTALTIADKKETPTQWLRRCKRNIDLTPIQLRPEMETSTQGHQIAFENGSRYYIGSAQGGFPGVGDTIHFLHISEVCWWDKPPVSKNPDDILNPLMPAVPSGEDIGGSVVVRDSTGAMVGDWWNLRYTEARDADNEFVNIFLPWFLVDTYRRADLAPDVIDYTPHEKECISVADSYGLEIDKAQIAWWRDTLKTDFSGDMDECCAAYPSTEEEAFMAPGITVYKRHHIQGARETIRDPQYKCNILGDGAPFSAIFDNAANGEMSVWEEPDERYHYVIGADCQWGKNKEADWDVFFVECLETGKICAKVKGHYPLDYWGWKIAAVGARYNMCPVAPETNGQEAASAGSVIGALLGRAGNWSYPNIWIRSDDMKLKGYRPDDYGWWTTHQNKAQMIYHSMTGTLDGSFDWADADTVTQATTIIRRDDNSLGAPEGLYDDDWMARMITGYVAHRERARTELYVEPEPVVYRFRTMEERMSDSLAETDNEGEDE